jgi:thymidylate synthase
MRQYLEALNQIMVHGVAKTDRTGIGTKSLFGLQMRFDLQQGFPLVTTKKVHLKSVIYELLWFLRGDTNVRYLQAHGVSIWDEWADDKGDLGPVYGKQWRAWACKDGSHKDQLTDLLQRLQNEPHSRRHIVSAWNVGEISEMALPPCHLLFQFYVAEGKLSCQLTQRSADMFLGVPFNIASYALLTHMIAQQGGFDVGEFIWSGGDCHIYTNHFTQVQEQLTRTPKPLPQLVLRPRPTLFDYVYEDIEILHYDFHPAIKAPVAV